MNIDQFVEKKVCPGTEAYGDCYYPATPDHGAMQWDCKPGYFCISPDQIDMCTPGFYCPGNSSQPIYCPEKYNCSIDTRDISRCSEGFSCPIATTHPHMCWLSQCLEGTASTMKPGIVPVGAAIILIYTLISYVVRKSFIKFLFWKLKPNLNSDETAIHRITGLTAPLKIEFQDLSWKLPSGRIFLDSISGTLESGNFYAILGPSGSGKSTLINLLMGKIKGTGKITVNGVIKPLKKIRKLVGFVPQDDIMLRELTVLEILYHSAKMRLPKSYSNLTIKNIVNETIQFLGLSHVTDQIIGCEIRRGISGGQRKRVNIGIELVAEPCVLFLDEPTSGLDSSTAFDICRKMKELTETKNMLVIAVIHTPTQKIFNLFDQVFLLDSSGSLIYNGIPSEIKPYFESKGYALEEGETECEFALDIAQEKRFSSTTTAIETM